MVDRALFVRLDKIGDLICTLPVDQIEDLRPVRITWAVNQGLGFLPSHSVPKRDFFEVKKSTPWPSFFGVFRWCWIHKPQLAVSFQAPWWINLALWLARVPTRVGVYSQWHSFLFLNKGLRQRRSESKQHEFNYNLDLIYFALNQPLPPWGPQFGGDFTQDPYPKLELKASNTGVLSRLNLSLRSYVVIHPGMAGSALNWEAKKYLELTLRTAKKMPVVITGTSQDDPWLSEIKRHLGFGSDRSVNEDHGHPILFLQDRLKSEELLEVLGGAQCVFAPSTGVAHLADGLGTPVRSLFSPLRVQHPTRWRPRGPRSLVFMPPVQCPGTQVCLGSKCPDFFCMNKIKPEDVLDGLI